MKYAAKPITPFATSTFCRLSTGRGSNTAVAIAIIERAVCVQQPAVIIHSGKLIRGRVFQDMHREIDERIELARDVDRLVQQSPQAYLASQRIVSFDVRVEVLVKLRDGLDDAHQCPYPPQVPAGVEEPQLDGPESLR